MDRSWIGLNDKWCDEYVNGVSNFIKFASRHADGRNRIRCPCSRCVNVTFRCLTDVREHLHQNGMLEGYVNWVFHGEGYGLGEVAVNVSGDCVDDIPETRVDVEGLIGDLQEGRFAGNVGDDISSDETHLKNGEGDTFAKLLSDAQCEAYPGCRKFSKLSLIIRLLHIKTLCKWSNKSVNMVLDLLRELLPPGHTVPKSFYEAKNILRELGLGYVNIHACPNNCALYWKENENLDRCPNSDCRESRWKECRNGKKIPRKVLRYFPVKPRLQKLFMSKNIAKDMRWHKDRRVHDSNVIAHPADAKQWQDFDKEHEWFAQDPRNIRLGLASDGFNPFSNMSSTYSMWPVMLVIYNVGATQVMKDPFIIMPLLIPGPHSPGNDIDVFFRPLIDDLKDLWEEGIETYDAYSGERFMLHAALLWTINDFPAYGMLSGWSTKGKLACPPCNKETHHIRLKHSKKQVYMGHRRFLPLNHPWRRNKKFNGKLEPNPKPKELSGDDVLDQLKSLPSDLKFGKTLTNKKRKRPDKELNWRKRSIFFELSYWKTLKIRHNLDVMHVEKNVCESVLGTLMSIDGKTKDTENSRKDLAELGIMKELHVRKEGDGDVIPHAPYCLDVGGRKNICEWLKNIKFPDGYASNISRCVSSNDNKIIGMKSHDYHVLLQRLLPLAIRGNLSKQICDALTDLSMFFKELSSRTLTVDCLEGLERDIVLILCKLELIFPPSFFDVMMHLPVHLPREVMYGGPVQYRWMYPIERFLYTLKQYVRNKARPEGSIAEAYIDNECLNFCSMYLDGVETRYNRADRNHEGVNISRNSSLSIFSRPVRPLSASQVERLTPSEYEIVRWFVLHNCEEIDTYMNKHLEEIELRESSNVEKTHQLEFADWFKNLMVKKRIDMSVEATDDLYSLACGPDRHIKRYTGCVINGMRFHTNARDERRVTQNSGVLVRADHEGTEIDFYGVLTDIIELTYVGGYRVFIFKCNWFNTGDTKTGVRKDKYFTSVNVSRTWYKGEPYILASQAQQVFYVPDVILGKNYRIVQKIQPRNWYNISETEEETSYRDIETDAYQQSFSTGKSPVTEFDPEDNFLLSEGEEDMNDDDDDDAADDNDDSDDGGGEDYSSDGTHIGDDDDGDDDDDYDTDLGEFT